MARNRGYYLGQRRRVIARKCAILRGIGGEKLVAAWARGATGRFAKGKIHCSCPLCRRKSRDELAKRDKSALASAKQQLDENMRG